MFNSSNFNTNFSILHDDNTNNNNNNNNNIPLFSQPITTDEIIQSPSFYNDYKDYFDPFNNDDHLTMIQELLHATNNNNSIVVIDDYSAILEVTTTNNNKAVKVIGRSKRRRTSKKDRHRKIATAHGLRDRRFRLSNEVARPFFTLQDRLKHNRPSKTVQWLLNCSKKAINDLTRSKIGTISSTSDYEDEFILLDNNNNINNNNNNAVYNNNNKNKGKKPIVNVEQKRLRIITKEGRKKAREKAKQIFLEKMQKRGDFVGVSRIQNWNTSTYLSY